MYSYSFTLILSILLFVYMYYTELLYFSFILHISRSWWYFIRSFVYPVHVYMFAHFLIFSLVARRTHRLNRLFKLPGRLVGRRPRRDLFIRGPDRPPVRRKRPRQPPTESVWTNSFSLTISDYAPEGCPRAATQAVDVYGTQVKFTQPEILRESRLRPRPRLAGGRRLRHLEQAASVKLFLFSSLSPQFSVSLSR